MVDFCVGLRQGVSPGMPTMQRYRCLNFVGHVTRRSCDRCIRHIVLNWSLAEWRDEAHRAHKGPKTPGPAWWVGSLWKKYF